MTFIHTYPSYVVDLGFKHRRKSFTYAELPKLMERLQKAEKVLIAFILYKMSIKRCDFDLTEHEQHVRINYEQAWLDYYGVDASEILHKYTGKDAVEWVVHRETLSHLLQSTSILRT